MFDNAEFIEWLTLGALVPVAGWGMWMQHRIGELDNDMQEIKDTLRLILQNTAITRGRHTNDPEP